MSDVLTAQLASNEQLVTAIKGTDGALHVANQAVEPGHDSTFNRVNVSAKASNKYLLTAAGLAGTAGQRTFKGVYVVAGTIGTTALTVYDGTASNANPIGGLAASATPFTVFTPPAPVPCGTGVYVNMITGGTVCVLVDETV